MTKLCFQHLPMPQFTTLQKRVFPVYFSLQFGLVLLTTATYPPRSLVSLAQGQSWGDCVALGLNAAMAGLNMFVYGPRTQKVMVEKIHQETKDARNRARSQEGNQNGEQASLSQEMRLLKRSFSRNHAAAIHLNAIAMIATVWYGFSLASRIKVTA